MSRTRGRLALLLFVYLALAALFGIVNPLFEAPDENLHYFTVQYVADERALPAVTNEPDRWMGQEAAQPPLYYLLGALLIAPIETGSAFDHVWANPRVVLGDATTLVNRNAFVHGPWEAWPWHGYALAAHLLRLFSTLLGLGSLLFLFASARLLWPAKPGRALLAVAMVAFLPQFLFLHSAVSNDPLIILLATAALFQLVRYWLHGAGRRALLLLGMTVGLALLSKTAGLLLLVYAPAVIILAQWRRERQWSAALSAAAWVVVPALAVGGWLLWRNWQLYGDPTAANQFVRLAGGDRDFGVLQIFKEGKGLWASLFAVFGWFTLRLPHWVYLIWNGIVLFALGSALWRLRRDGWPVRARRWLFLLLLTWLLLVIAGLVNFMLRTPAAQGRLLFPALLPLALALAYGLDRPYLRLLAAVLALVTALYTGLIFIPRAYAAPPALSTLPPQATSLEAATGHGLSLRGVNVETTVARPGNAIWLTLYWQADAPTSTAPERTVEMIVLPAGSEETTVVGKSQGYHGAGLYPASLWPAQRLIADRVGIFVDATTPAPVAVDLFAGLVGVERRVGVGRVKVVPEDWPAAPPPQARLSSSITLGGVSIMPQEVTPGTTVNVSVTWSVSEAPRRDLTTFVHLGQLGEPPLAAGDSQPRGGAYPTSMWAAGEVIVDSYRLALPPDLAPGRYPLLLGLYDPANGTRVPLSVDGERQEYDSFVAGYLSVVEPN